MKKLITLLVLVLIGTTQTWADGVMYLRNNISTNWDIDDENFKSEKTWDSTNSQDVYEFTINASTLGNNDFYFRLNRYDSDGKLIGPYNHQDYVFTFENGANETYKAPRIGKFQGDNGAFKIAHSTIKANQYKITVYLKYNENVTVDNTQYNGVWVYYIKVEIVDMPVTLSATKGTFSCDRALNFYNTGVSAYMITGASNGALTLSDAMTIVPANTGLYLEGSAGTVNIPVITTSDASEVDTDDNMLKPGAGVAVAETEFIETIEYTNFILTNQTTTGSASLRFYKANNNVVPVGKAYLQIPKSIVGARESFWFNEDVTAIDALKQATSTNGEYFNLAGQRVTQPTKGLYIVNGKKVIIK